MISGKMVKNKVISDQETISLSSLSPAMGSHHRRKIVGRGVGSGHGRHATRGMKGQSSRRGDTKMIGFEGGQMPLLRRIPKRGFTPPFPVRYSVVNVGDLEKISKSAPEVTPEILRKEGWCDGSYPIKILGGGEIKKALKVTAHAFSGQAMKKITASGGSAQCLPKNE